MRTAVKIIRRVLGCLFTALLAILLISNLYTAALRHFTGKPQPTVFGWSWAVVVSGSMEPEISVNDLIIVRKHDSYEVGDIISFESNNGSVVTHRIIAKTDTTYTTKGDANNTSDTPVSETAVIGKVAAIIPFLGIVIQFLRTPMGMLCLVLLGLLIILTSRILDKHTKDKGGCD